MVGLPEVLRPELPTIQKSLCTSAQLAANACPAASIVGSANANTPLLPQPLSGPVYLVQDPNPVDPLPRVVARLAGMASVELSARSTIQGVRTVNTFENIPDVPVSRFEIYINGGAPGILKSFYDLCSTTSRADATFYGQNGAAAASKPALEVGGCGPGGGGGVTISKKSIKVKRGVARVGLTCNSPDGCEGKLTLSQAGKKGKAKGPARQRPVLDRTEQEGDRRGQADPQGVEGRQQEGKTGRDRHRDDRRRQRHPGADAGDDAFQEHAPPLTKSR